MTAVSVYICLVRNLLVFMEDEEWQRDMSHIASMLHTSIPLFYLVCCFFILT